MRRPTYATDLPDGQPPATDDHASATHVSRSVQPWSERLRSCIVRGIVAGAVGAGAIAAFFQIIDITRGEPFRTPGVLGSALFMGELLPVGAAPAPVIVVAYTVVHASIFIAMGVMVAYALVGWRREFGVLRSLAIATALFAAFQVCSMLFAGFLEPRLVESLGASAVTIANALAAIVMTAVLEYSRERVDSRERMSSHERTNSRGHMDGTTPSRVPGRPQASED